MTFCFDMDGTIADLYGQENWLDDLINERTNPYDNAKPMLNLSLLAKAIHKAQARGDKVEIVSWLSKSGSAEYGLMVTESKLNWLKRHLPSVRFDNIYIVPYGTPKSKVTKAKEAILFDDEENNRIEWIRNKGYSFAPNRILEILKAGG